MLIRFRQNDGTEYPQWEEKRLGDLTDLYTGKSFSTNLETSGNYIVMDMGTISQDGFRIEKKKTNLKRDVLQKNDLVMPKDDIGGGLIICKTVHIPKDNQYVLGDHVFRLRFLEENGMFMHYLINSDKVNRNLKNKVTGSAQLGIRANNVKNQIIHVPCLEEQQKIADFLFTVDQKIEAQKSIVTDYEELKKGTMQKIFNQEIRFKDNDGNEFPEWEEKNLLEIASLINGRAYKAEEMLHQGKYLLLRVGNLFSNNEYFYSDLELEEDKYICNGDLIYAWSATFGPRIYHGEKCIYHYHIWKVIPHNVNKMYLFYLLDRDILSLQSQLNGGTMQHITKGDMEKRIFSIPCLKEQKKIADCLSALDRKIEAEKKILADLEELKKGLLQAIFNN